MALSDILPLPRVFLASLFVHDTLGHRLGKKAVLWQDLLTMHFLFHVTLTYNYLNLDVNVFSGCLWMSVDVCGCLWMSVDVAHECYL